MGWKLFGVILVFITVGCEGESKINRTQIGNVTYYDAEGNLEVTDPVRCVGIEDLKNTQTPADIFVGVGECVSIKEYEKAVALYAAAFAYGKYDTLRVKDKSAHQGLIVISINTFSQFDEEVKVVVSTLLKETFDDVPKLKEICKSLKVLGAPNYSPRYMLQHGMSAFTGENAGLIEGFDETKSWKVALMEYLKCEAY